MQDKQQERRALITWLSLWNIGLLQRPRRDKFSTLHQTRRFVCLIGTRSSGCGCAWKAREGASMEWWFFSYFSLPPTWRGKFLVCQNCSGFSGMRAWEEILNRIFNMFVAYAFCVLPFFIGAQYLGLSCFILPAALWGSSEWGRVIHPKPLNKFHYRARI